MEKHDFVTIANLTREKILYMIEMAQEFEKHPNRELLKGKVVATLFFEPSTRTRLSFETAANRLGARVIGFADPKITSGTKGETLKDTISMVANYADVIVMRHYIEGAAQYATEVTNIPIVNAGDGAHQHPSQCMLDLYSIYKTQGTLENLNIYLVGDLKYGRTVHSLIMAMRHFNPTFHFVAPKELAMPNEYKLYCKEHGIKFQEHTAFNEKVIADADILYMTRVQKERFSDLMEYERVKNVYVLDAFVLHQVAETLFLYTGHIQDVGIGNHLLVESSMLLELNAVFFAVNLILIGHGQFLGGHKMEGGIEVAHGHNQRVYGTPVFQIAYQVDVQVLQCPLCLIDRIKVKHTLRGVLVCSVSCIDNGNARHFGSILGCTFYIMAHHDDISIIGYHGDGVFECFALRATCYLGIGKSDNSCTKSVGSSFKTQSGTGGWLKE